ncbi:MAG: hypothetical protein PHN56_06795 [Candidatus Nanoarchaeia archaeon]|nr:hypothetical protein [Candidatus Nanoarchaeia archaeon]
MKLFGKDVNILKSFDIFKSEKTNRPTVPYEALGCSEEGVMPILPLNYQDCESIYLISDTLGTIIDKLTEEIFRNGYEWKANFIKKCTKCGATFKKNLDVCTDCGGAVRDPIILDPRIKEELLNQKVNNNNQTLSDVEESISTDLDVDDIGFLMLNKDYSYVENKLTNVTISEILKMDPKITRIVANQRSMIGYNENNEEVRFCPMHRNKVFVNTETCPTCGKDMFRACYVSIQEGSNYLYYSDSEVIHTTKYKKGLLYGWPRIIRAYTKSLTLIKMDDLVLKWYKGEKPPRGFLMVGTSNNESLQKAWKTLLENLKKDPNGIYPLGVPNKESSKGKLAEFVQLTNTLEEMQYSQTREEMRRTIGALWGVMPVFQADISTSGGLNNEGMQVTVTTRAALKGQAVFNKKITPWLLKQFGVEEWNLELVTPEEKDEMAELQRKQLDIANAQAMLNMGFEVEYDEDGEFIFSGKAQKPMQFMNPGMPGETPQTETPPDANNDFSGSPEAPIDNVNKSRIDVNKSEIVFDADLKKLVQDEIEDIEKSEEANIATGSEVIDNILKETLYDFVFSGIDKNKSDLIKDYLIKQVGESISLKTITKAISEIGKVNKEDAERIARTEYVNVLQNKSREIGYKLRDDGNYKYTWKSIPDSRRTTICEKISKRCGSGVKMDELKKIIKEEADKNIYGESRPWTSHINCRSRLLRKV